jgi:trk system potassium uptake protein TrkH
LRRRSLWRRLSAPQVFAGSFLLLIAVGTIGLKAIPGLYVGKPLGWVDALFTATSAVCVTGLIVVDTATVFSIYGQAWLLLLIQLGGLGIITFTTLLTGLLGQRLSLRSEGLSLSGGEIAPHIDVRRLTRDVVLFTLMFEVVGAMLLYGLWGPRLGWRDALWPAVFHSISAFCNAGFSTFSDSMVGFRQSPLTLLVIMGLIIAGGLGFLTMEEVWLWSRYRPTRTSRRPLVGSGRGAGPARLSLHSRLVLTVTALAIVVPWLPMLLLEWDRTLGDLPAWHKPVNALFLSITPRTAGFNNVDYALADDGTNFLTIILMGIGGSPGSTAGGLKTTTIAVIGLLAWARLHRHEITSLWGRTIPEETIQRAVGLIVGVSALLIFCVFVLTVSEERLEGSGNGERFLQFVFECTSAFNTVGLSMGATAGLSNVGKLVMIILMFVGRVGPATAASALSLPAPTASGEFRYAYEDVLVG